jgi:hypothetical protein
MLRHLHVRRTPSSPPLSTASFTPKAYPFHSIHFAPPPPSAPRAHELSRRRPSRTAAPPRATAPREPPSTFQPQADPLVVEGGTPKKCHRSRAAAADSLHNVSPHRSSSDHTRSTPSTARAPDTFPSQHSDANDRRSSPPHRSPSPDRPQPSSNRHGEPPVAFCLKSEPPSPGATPRLFPCQPTTASRSNFTGEPPASGEEFSSPVSHGWARLPSKLGRLAEQVEFGCGLSPSAQ